MWEAGQTVLEEICTCARWHLGRRPRVLGREGREWGRRERENEIQAEKEAEHENGGARREKERAREGERDLEREN